MSRAGHFIALHTGSDDVIDHKFRYAEKNGGLYGSDQDKKCYSSLKLNRIALKLQSTFKNCIRVMREKTNFVHFSMVCKFSAVLKCLLYPFRKYGHIYLYKVGATL